MGFVDCAGEGITEGCLQYSGCRSSSHLLTSFAVPFTASHRCWSIQVSAGTHFLSLSDIIDTFIFPSPSAGFVKNGLYFEKLWPSSASYVW